MILGLAVLVILLLLVLRFPPVALLALGLTSVAGDGFGLNSALRQAGYGFVVQGIVFLTFVAWGISTFRVLADRSAEPSSKRAKLLVLALLALVVWVAVASLAKGLPLKQLPGVVMYSGAPVAAIVLAYWKRRATTYLVIALLVVQLVMALFVVLYPAGPLGPIAASKYAPEFQGEAQEFQGDAARAGIFERMFAQFRNTNSYGLYALIGFALGGYLLLFGRGWRRFLGLALIPLCLFGFLVTLSRGASLGLLLGLMFVARKEVLRRKGLLLLSGALLVGVVVFLGSFAGGAVAERFAVPFDDWAFRSRIDAARLGWDQVLKSPLLGTPLDFAWPGNIRPHQLFLYFMALHGIPAGLLAAYLLFRPLLYSLRLTYARREVPRERVRLMHLCTVVAWIVFGTGITNNVAAPVLFWIGWAYGAGPWLGWWREAWPQAKAQAVAVARGKVA